jgi:hypothetical protein
MGVSAYDEALSVPSEQAHQQSVRVQQILMHETNLTAVGDPLGGSYYVEALSAELEQRAYAFLAEIEEAWQCDRRRRLRHRLSGATSVLAERRRPVWIYPLRLRSSGH